MLSLGLRLMILICCPGLRLEYFSLEFFRLPAFASNTSAWNFLLGLFYLISQASALNTLAWNLYGF